MKFYNTHNGTAQVRATEGKYPEPDGCLQAIAEGKSAEEASGGGFDTVQRDMIY